VAEYNYDGKGRRVTKTVTNSGVSDTAGDGGNTTVHYYYDNKWRIIETRNGSNQTTRQFVWGTRRMRQFRTYGSVRGAARKGGPCRDRPPRR
jgi:hypothetical protein